MLGMAKLETKLGLSPNQNRIDSGSAYSCSCNEGELKYLSLDLVRCLVTVSNRVNRVINRCAILLILGRTRHFGEILVAS
jgi:hypothetical protein